MENKAMLNTIVEDAIKVVTDPAGFYRDMKKTGGFADPVIFVLVMAVIMGIVIAIFSLFGIGMVGVMAAGFGAIIIMPIFAVIGSFIGATVMFVIWKLMGSGESYETAYRCVAYAAALYPITAVLGLVPYLGSVVGVIWGMYLMIIASTQVHGLNQKTAYTVFGILGALMVVVSIGNEMASRKMSSVMQDMEEQFGNIDEQLEQSGEMTPEQAGKAMGEFLKGFSEAAGGKDDSATKE